MSTHKKPANSFDLEFTLEQAVSFDLNAFDTAIRSQGVELIHHRAMRCPVGLIDKYDSRRPHDDHSGCSNGFIYTKAGTATGLFLSNTHAIRQMGDMGGVWDGSTVQVTMPRSYEDSQEVMHVVPFDRFYLAEESIVVPHWQLVEAHATGRDRLHFPVIDIIDIMDNQGRRYHSGAFDIEAGQIVWQGQHQPGVDAETGRGRVYSVRFTYRPFWLVQRVLHEVRVTQQNDPFEGTRKTVRAPQSFILNREYVSLKEDKDEQAPNPSSPRQVYGPPATGFGPR